MTLLLRDVEIGGRPGQAVLVRGGSIDAIGPTEDVRADDDALILAGDGGVLLPGLHDHHIHLLALAARDRSLWCGPPRVTRPDDLVATLRSAAPAVPPDDWVRAVGWDDTLAGWPDRHDLDAAVADRPVRLQHRTGSLWVLNSEALARLDIDADVAPPGLQRDGSGTPTGRLFGADAWLADRLGAEPPDLTAVGGLLAARGVTGVTDATAHNGPAELAELARQHRAGRLPQRLTAMTAPGIDGRWTDVTLGPVKLVLADDDLPARRDLMRTIEEAHAHGRAVAIHAASRLTVVYAATALGDAGRQQPRRTGDRIEHASVAPPDVVTLVARAGAAVVTQHNFVAESGERYLRTVEPDDRPWLYRGRGFLDAGVALAGGTDAPVGDPDPFAAMRAAVTRTTARGRSIAPEEALTPEQALALFTGAPHDPGGPPRVVVVGAPADLCLLDRPWAAARRRLDHRLVRATIIDGVLTHDPDGDA